MPKLTPSENKLLELIGNAGGSYCPGAVATISSATHKLIRRLQRQGVIIVEQTDDGFRYSLTEALHG
jgi:DNA-binding IclR family transcriptional regulator